MRKLSEDERYMRQAITLAKKAAANGDVPIGCVIVYEGKVIARGYNRRNVDKTTLAHAEIMAIKKASKVLGDWRLEDCTMYVTLEPCQMCAGAIVQARIPEVVIGCMNPQAGLVIKFPCSRGDSGALYPQSATEGVMAGFGLSSCEAAHGKWR